jgi:ribosomal protein L31E
LIENFTRVSDSSSSIIDHIYVNKSENIRNYGVLQCAICDHQPIFVKRKLSFRSKTKNIKHKTIKYQDFKKINVKRVENDLLNMEMKLKDPQDLNEICNQYNEEIHRIMKKHIKTKEVRIKHKMHEWVNQDIIELMKRRDKLRIKIIKLNTENKTYQQIPSLMN